MKATVPLSRAVGNCCTYAHDALDRRTWRVDDGAVTNAFGYNPRSEVTTDLMDTNSYSYAYDGIHLLYACMLLTMLAGACANSDPHLMTGDSPDCMQYAIGNTKETGVSSGTGKATIVNSGRNMEWPAFYFERHRRFIADVRSEYGLTNFIIGGRANWISSANQGSSNAVGIVEVTFITNTIPLIVDVTLRFQFNEGGMHRSIPLSDQIEVISMLVSDITFKFKELIAPTDGFQVWPGGVFFSIEAPTVAREHIDMFEWRKVEELAYLRKMLEEIWTSKINVGE